MDAILGTAGHIDHGKTSLVRALTGINCDRLDEEKRRGITIDLGFAWLDLPDGRRLGIVDVPGHERFVKTMVAGASGIDCMLLVVAADEGVMPQTREHLDICTLLGVRSGIVALTKTDMVDPDWLEMVSEDVAANLQGTFLRDAPIIPVSSATGAGIDELRAAVFSLVSSLKEEKGTNILRLPVDRVFTLRGFGTVVTGTIVSGTCAQGEELAVMPTGRQTRARSLQVHGNSVGEARHGQRCAMNLQGIEVEDIQRGDVLARPGTLFPSRRWLARISCLASAPHPIRQRMEAHFHHGSRECSARIIFRDREELQPGDSAIAEIHMAMPLVGVFGDHCVIRAHSPLRTIAGGVLLDPLPPILRKRDPNFAQKFAMLEKLGQLADKIAVKLTDKDAEELVRLALTLCGVPGTDEKHLAVLTGLPAKTLAAAIAKDASRGGIICWDNAAKCWVDREAFATSLARCRERAQDLHEREPLKGFFAHNALCSGWGEKLPPKYAQKVLDEAVKKGILKEEGNGLKLAGWEIRPDADQSAAMEQLLKIYQDAALTPPMLKEIQESLGTEPRQTLSILAHLCETGQLAKVQDGLYYSRPILDNILARVREWFASHENLDVSDMKTILGVSRKYAIPLLEYMDASRITYRVGNLRQLKK